MFLIFQKHALSSVTIDSSPPYYAPRPAVQAAGSPGRTGQKTHAAQPAKYMRAGGKKAQGAHTGAKLTTHRILKKDEDRHAKFVFTSAALFAIM